MKRRIIRLTIGLTSLIAGFLPQKAAADEGYCKINCPDGSWCEATGQVVECKCVDGSAVCSS